MRLGRTRGSAPTIIPSLIMGSRNHRPCGGHVAFLSLGSNLGDTRQHLRSAHRALAAAGVLIEEASPYYATEPVDFEEQPWFLNQIIRVRTDLTPMQLLESCLRTEMEQDRQRGIAKGPRTLDIDVLLYDDLVLQDRRLQIPHPRMHLRRFVLEPLAVMAPGVVHPVLQETMTSLLSRCQDASQVQRLEETG